MKTKKLQPVLLLIIAIVLLLALPNRAQAYLLYENPQRIILSAPANNYTTANAAVIGRLMNNVKMGYYPTDPDNISLLLRGIQFPEGVTTNLLDPCCGCGKALRQVAQGNNCYAYGVEMDESRAEEAQTRLRSPALALSR